MKKFYTNKSIAEITKKYGPIRGTKTNNSLIYYHAGNWCYKPVAFYADTVQQAIATAMNIEAEYLTVWCQEKKEFITVMQLDCLMEFEEEEFMNIFEEGMSYIGARYSDLIDVDCKNILEYAY